MAAGHRGRDHQGHSNARSEIYNRIAKHQGSDAFGYRTVDDHGRGHTLGLHSSTPTSLSGGQQGARPRSMSQYRSDAVVRRRRPLTGIFNQFSHEKAASFMSDDLEKYGFDFKTIEDTFDARLMSYEETLREIAKVGVSMARFGDGELKQLFRPYNIGFQPFSTSLQADLREVVTSHEPNVLVGFPPVFRNEQWAGLWRDILDDTIDLFRHERVFANTAVSRPPCFSELGTTAVDLWMKVWDQRTICIVTGRGSRFDLHPEFFGNASKIDFLHSSPIDAYAQMDELMAQIAGMPSYDKYLLSLGPTATIMANRLAALGRDALDIGHLSGSYSYVIGQGVYPERMPLTR